MRILYLDESGDDGTRGSMHYVLAGLCLKESNVAITQDKVRNLVMKTFRHGRRIRVPEMYSKQEFDSDKLTKKFDRILWTKPELHYAPLNSNKPPYDRLKGDGRKKLADNVFQIILDADPKLFGVVINKKNHFKKYLIPSPVDLFSMEMLAERFQAYLELENDIGIMIYDQKDKHNNAVFRNFVNYIRTDGTSKMKLPRIVENLMFLPSDLCEPLQLADFIAHSLFLKYERQKHQRMDLLKKIFFSVKVFP